MSAQRRNALRSLLVLTVFGVICWAVTSAGAAAPGDASFPPENITKPTISGNQVLGGTLTCTPGEWTESPTSISYEWLEYRTEVVRDPSGHGSETITYLAPIAGTEGNAYTSKKGDSGHVVVCSVTATNAAGPTKAISDSLMIWTAPDFAGGVGVTAGKEFDICSVGKVNGNPTPILTIQWLIDGVVLTDPNLGYSTFDLAKNHEYAGRQLSCRVTATNSAGSDTSTSWNSVEVTAPPWAKKAPSVSGTPQVGSTLTCSPGEWGGLPTPSVSLLWQRDGKNIGGAKSPNYTLVSPDGGHQITCVVTVTNSAKTIMVTTEPKLILVPPWNYNPPVLGGAPLIGRTATCSTGEWEGTPTPTLSFSWFRDSTPIEGAESSTYEPTAADGEHLLRCRVTGTNVLGTVVAVSKAVEVPSAAGAPVNVTPPRISGHVHARSTLTCEPGEWTGAPKPTLTYRWETNGTVRGEASPTYVPGSSDFDRELRCVVTASNVAGTMSVASAAVIPSEVTCSGGPITGLGSPLGSIQTELWAPPTAGYNAICGENEVRFTTGDGLSAWGFKGGAFDTGYSFVTSDGPPRAPQIEAARKSIPGITPDIRTIPVAQTAIAFPVHPPAGCTITEITNKQLEAVMRGTIKIWNKLQTAVGAGCTNAPITRVVAGEGSGATYQAKEYLLKISEASLTCLPASVKTPTWRGIEEIGVGGSEEPNTLWPENSAAAGCTNQVTELIRGDAGAGVVKAVNATEGSIGYAALPDVETFRTGTTHWLKLQNNGVSNKLSVAKFAAPVEGGQTANCFEAQYPLPLAVQLGGVGLDWSQVTGANTKEAAISSASYPLCALIYVETADNVMSRNTMEATRDYVRNYLLGTAGQEALELGGKWYAPLPTGPTLINVLAAAKASAPSP